MSLFTDIFKTAKNVVSGGVNVLADQLSSETVYQKDKGIVSDTGGKPKIIKTASDILFPNRGYTSQQMKDAPVTAKDTAIGVAKTAGEIVKGGVDVLAGIGRPIASAVLPGYKDMVNSPESVAFRDNLDKKVTDILQPSNASQAKVMRGADVLGVLPIGSISKIGKFEKVLDAARLSDLAKTEDANTARKILIDAVPGFKDVPSDKVDELSRFIASSKSPNEIGKTVDAVASSYGVKTAPAVKTADGTFSRSYSERAAKISPEAQGIGATDTTRNTTKLAQKAKNLIAEDPVTAENMMNDLKSGKKITDSHIAVASELLNKYQNEARLTTDIGMRNHLYDKVAEIANSTAGRLTEQGRAVQAASILGRITPEGMARFAAREIQKYNEKIANPAKHIPNLTGEQAQKIIEGMTEVNKMPDGIEKARKLHEVQQYVNTLVPSSTFDKIVNVWKAGLLTGIKTSGLNTTSNIAHSFSEIAKDAPAAVVDKITSLFTGKRTKTFTIRGYGSGLKEGVSKGLSYVKTGFDQRDIARKLDYSHVNFGKGPVAKAFQTYTDSVFRFIGAQDQPFYYGAASRSIMDQAIAKGKTAGLSGEQLINYAHELASDPTEEMIRYATLDATTAVFQNKTKLGEAAKHIQNIPYVGKFIVPFAQTPSAVAMQIINYSPAGIVKTIIENAGRGNFDQRLFSQGLGRGIVGTAPLAIGAALYNSGLVQLDYPTSNERQIELDKQAGRTYNSIKIGGQWRNANTLGPVGNLVLIGAYFQKAFNESGSPSEAMVKAGLGALNSFTEQTFLTGINQFVNAVSDPKTYAKSYLPNLVASFVPTAVSDIAQATDPIKRNSNGNDMMSSFIPKIKARVPGAHQTLPADVTAFGDINTRKNNGFESMFDPSRPSNAQDTPLTQELSRLMDAGYKASPTKIGNKSGYPSLTAEQNSQLYQEVGSLVKSKLEKLIQHPQYQGLSDEEKTAQIQKITEKAQIVGRAQYIVHLTDGLDTGQKVELLKKLKADKLLTKQVFQEYNNLISE